MNMEMCRVCLSTEKQMFSLDETFINNYNLLTNLNITLLDGMPQYSCQTCLDTVKYFIEFRQKSITAETTLREVINSVKPENKMLVLEIDKSTTIYETETLLAVKTEIEEENYNIDKSLDNFDSAYSDYEKDDKNIVVKVEEDGKPKKIRKIKEGKLKVETSELLGTLSSGLEQKLFCGICPRMFEDKISLNNHLDGHRKDRQCNLCREILNSLSQLLAHRLMHVPLEQCKCHICERKFKSCIYLEHHYKNKHIIEDGRKLFCSTCQWACDTPKKLYNHMNIHSSMKYFCDMCSKGFHTKSSLRSHIRSHNDDRTYVCDLCGFSCKHSGGLKDHKIRRHSPHKVYCSVCRRPFQTQLAHDKHTCSKTFTVCPICGLQLGRTNRLSRHMVKHSDIQRYECKRCPAKYKTRSALMAHLDRHDGNRTQQCEYCPAKFYTRTVLVKHQRIHTGERPYICKVCNKGFTGNHNLKVHMKVHGEYLIIKK